MAVDENRVQRIFQAIVEAADPAHQAQILDRECASDPESRKCVEALLRSHREMPTLVGMPPPKGGEPPKSSSAVTISAHSSTSNENTIVFPNEPATTVVYTLPQHDDDP